MILDPNQPDEDDNLLDYFLVGPIKLLELWIKFPGLFVLQYLFFLVIGPWSLDYFRR